MFKQINSIRRRKEVNPSVKSDARARKRKQKRKQKKERSPSNFKTGSRKEGGGGHTLRLMSQGARRAVGDRGQRSGVRLGSQVARGAVGQAGEESCGGDEAGPVDGRQEVGRAAGRSHHAQGVHGGVAPPCTPQELLFHPDPGALAKLLQTHLVLPLPLGSVDGEGAVKVRKGLDGESKIVVS